MSKAVVMAFLLCCRLLTAGDQPSVDMWVDRNELAVGDRLTVTVRYRWPPGWTVDEEPRPGTVFNRAGAFVVDLPPVERLRDGTAEQRTHRIALLATRSGPWALPRPGFQVTAPDGQIHTASAPAVVVTVGTEGADINPAPPSELWSTADDPALGPRSRWPWILALVIAAGAAVIILRQGRPAVEPPLSPEERFSHDCTLVQAAIDGKHAAHLLSQALRRYLGATQGFDGLGATTRELRRLLAESYDADIRHQILAILEELDAHRWLPDTLQAEALAPLLERARAWIAERQAESQDDTTAEKD